MCDDEEKNEAYDEWFKYNHTFLMEEFINDHYDDEFKQYCRTEFEDYANPLDEAYPERPL